MRKRRTVKMSSLLNKKKEKESTFQREIIDVIEETVSTNLDTNCKKMMAIMGSSMDLHSRDIPINQSSLNGTLFYISGLADTKQISDYLLKAIMDNTSMDNDIEFVGEWCDSFLSLLQKEVLTVANIKLKNDWHSIIHELLSGNTILFIDNINRAIVVSTAGAEWRSIDEPTSEITVRGPKDGFIESLQTNITLVRRRLKSPQLRFEVIQLGSVSKTDVAMIYVEGIANTSVINEVRKRLNKIDIDKVIGSGTVEEWIQDKDITVFPTVFNTERPDIVVNNLAEGRVSIIVDGSPFALIVPTDFSQFFKAAEDYYQRADLSTLIRMLRYVAFSVSLLGPSIYIALITFHQDLIPTTLLISLAAQREGIPFPALIEALIMEITFEVLREAGVRMPRAIGQAVSIVGALVIGQAAVQAGIVSAAMVIVVAGTAIASFTTPAYNIAVAARILRFVMMIIAATMGLYGIMIGLIILVAHMSSLRSFGTSYLGSFAPINVRDQLDGILRGYPWKRNDVKKDMK